ncbi:MAG: hypothetical protein IPM38_12930, partial [Ignavibacteria bacterium]|nr:hypothetical protein [Ignavibacteria bacterium]
HALRIRLNGDVLVAMGTNILRLNAAGTTIQTYDVAGENSWFGLNLDPDGTSFWSADFTTSNVYRIDIATGNVITTYNTGTANGTVFGIAVAGEITAATVLNITVAPKNSINPINTQHCVTATVTDQFAVPQDNVNVIFVVRGVNAPQILQETQIKTDRSSFVMLEPIREEILSSLQSELQEDLIQHINSGKIRFLSNLLHLLQQSPVTMSV